MALLGGGGGGGGGVGKAIKMTFILEIDLNI